MGFVSMYHKALTLLQEADPQTLAVSCESHNFDLLLSEGRYMQLSRYIIIKSIKTIKIFCIKFN